MCLTPGGRTAAVWQRRFFAADLFQKSVSRGIAHKDPGVFPPRLLLEAPSQEKGSAAKTGQEGETELVERQIFDFYFSKMYLAKALY